jgi:hypothetical protein
MSHTFTLSGVCAVFTTLTIVNYTAGGESISFAELNAASDQALADIPPIASGQSFICGGLIAPSMNSLGVILFALFTPGSNALSAGSVKLYQLTGGALAEIPTTTALNAKLPLIIRNV